MSIGLLWGERLKKYIKKVKKSRKKSKTNKKKRRNKNKGRKKKGGRSRKNNISKYLPWLFERKTRKRRK